MGEDIYKELKDELELHIPGLEELEKALESIGRGIELSRDERNTILRSLERTWHLMRLVRCLSNFFRDNISFGGGAILNYIYMVNVGEKPRFTFDVDTAWRRPARVKRDILAHIPLLNKWLAERGFSLKIPVDEGKFTRLWIVEYDVEKDFFPDVLSLRVPVIMKYTGRPFYEFLGISNCNVISKLREVFKETLGIRDPLIDYLRFEISLEMHDVPVVRLKTTDLFGNNLRVLVTELELQLAWKILGRVGKQHENLKAVLHDILKATLDLRLLKHCYVEKVREYIVTKEDPNKVLENSRKNLEALRIYGTEHWNGHHYALLRKVKTLDEVVTEILEILTSLLS